MRSGAWRAYREPVWADGSGAHPAACRRDVARHGTQRSGAGTAAQCCAYVRTFVSVRSDPRSVIDDNAVSFTATVVPGSLTPGNYSLRLRLADTTPGRPDIVIQSANRDAEGRVILGTSTVVADPAHLFGDGFEAP